MSSKSTRAYFVAIVFMEFSQYADLFMPTLSLTHSRLGSLYSCCIFSFLIITYYYSFRYCQLPCQTSPQNLYLFGITLYALVSHSNTNLLCVFFCDHFVVACHLVVFMCLMQQACTILVHIRTPTNCRYTPVSYPTTLWLLSNHWECTPVSLWPACLAWRASHDITTSSNFFYINHTMNSFPF